MLSPLSVGWAEDSSDLAVHFESNGRDLNSSDQERIAKAFKNVELGVDTKILVVGYTDSIGSKNANYALSRRRADTVKNHLVGLLKLDPSRVVAVGRGAEAPVARNGTAKERALNRRAEIFILGKPGNVFVVTNPSSADKDPPPPPPPNPEDYMDLLKKAQKLIKLGHFEEALVLLEDAQKKGAAYNSLYHLLIGIIGYFQGLETNRLIIFFNKSLQLDPHNLEARDFLGRARARKNFEQGIIKADMGRTVSAPIKVETISQEYEFMKLFQVEPLRQARLLDKPVDLWTCRTSNESTVEYYFDVSSVYQWALVPDNQLKGEGKENAPKFFPW